MSFLLQHIEGLVLVVLGLVILVGFLRQFGVVQGRGLLGLIAGVAALFGWSIFQNARKRRIREEIEADSLSYLSIDAIAETLDKSRTDLCLGCVTGEYPYDIEGEATDRDVVRPDIGTQSSPADD